LNYNVGDYALGFGVKNLLRHNLPLTLIGETNLQGREFTPYYINEVVNKRYDLLVIGGGGIIHGKHWPQGWFWLIDKDLISSIKIPFIVYGAGYNYFEGEGEIPEHGIKHLAETIKHAAYFSVRNDGSKDRLKRATKLEARVVPDPGFHVSLDRNWGERIREPFVVVEVANDKSELRYKTSDFRRDFVAELRSVIRWIVKSYKVILIPHVFEDISFSMEIAEGMENTELLPFREFAFDRCEEVMRYYRDARFVLAMRGHGQIIPLGFRTPVFSFSTHEKLLGMAASLGLPELHVNMSNGCFGEDLIDRIRRFEANPNKVRDKIRSVMRIVDDQTREEWMIIKDRLHV